MQRISRCSPLLVVASLALIAAGCYKPMVMESLTGRPQVFPDVVVGRPTLVAFLSANDRRCDRAIRPLTSLFHRDGTPVQVLGILTYDDYAYVRDIETVNDAPFTILLDPDRRLVERFSVTQYPTYLFLDTEGDELDRAHDIREVKPWVDSPRWHEKAFGMKEGTIQTYERLTGRTGSRPGYAEPQPSSGGAGDDRYDRGRYEYERYRSSLRHDDSGGQTHLNPGRSYDRSYDRSRYGSSRDYRYGDR